MHSSDDLFLLIKSLDKSEKRHFRLQAALQKGDKNYLKLFEVLENMASDDSISYDERLLKKKLGDKIAANQLHVFKNYLYKHILKSLRTLHEETGTEMKIALLLSEAKILEQKGLYEQVYKKIHAAKQLALKFEKYGSLVELLQFETVLCVRHKSQEVQTELAFLYEAIFKYLDWQVLEAKYKQLQGAATTLYRKGVRARDEDSKGALLRLETDALLKPDIRPATFLSRVSYHYTKALLSKIAGHHTQAVSHYRDLLAVWTGYPHFKEEYPVLYIIYTSNYLVGCHLIRNYEPFPVLMDELGSLPLRHFDEKAEAFQNIWYLRQLYFINHEIFNIRGDIVSEARKIADEIENALELYGQRIVKARQMSFCHNTGIMFFALGEYERAMYWLGKIQQADKTDQRRDLQLLAKLLQLVIFTEKGEHLYIERAFKAFEYHLKKEDKLHDFEGTVTAYLKQIVTRKEGNRTIFEKFQEALRRFEPDKITGCEEISIWAESKRRNMRFIDVLKERAGRK